MTDKQPITFEYVYQRVEYYLKSVADQARKPVLYVANYQSIRGFQIVEFNKITLLFGPNSAGKSALLDAVDDLTEILRRKDKQDFFLRDLCAKRMNWDVMKDDNEPLVLGFGGLELSYEPHESEVPNSYDIYEDIIQTGPVNATTRTDLLLFISKGGYVGCCYWDSGELLFADGPFGYEYEVGNTGIAFYGSREFKNLVRKKESESNTIMLSLTEAPKDWRFDDKNSYALPIEFCTDRSVKPNNDTLFTPNPPLMLSAYYEYEPFVDINIGENNLYIGGLETPLGIVLTFFIGNQPTHLREELIRYSRLTPLRYLPLESDLIFEFDKETIFGASSDIYRKRIKGDKPKILTGIEYWENLASELYRNAINYDPSFTRPALQRVNEWLSKKHLFNTGYIVSAKQEALIKLPFSADEKNIDLEKVPIRITLSLRTKHGKKIEVVDVGTGISQLLPVIVACEVEDTLAIEQPELHLHPAHQLLLGDLLVERLMWLLEKKDSHSVNDTWTIVETHSEHLILRLLRRIKESSSTSSKNNKYKISNEHVSVYYFNPTDEGTIIKKLRIDENGEFIDDWPRGFFEEGFTERFGGE